MAYTVRKGDNSLQYAVVKALNSLRAEDAAKDGYFHADVTSTTSGGFTNPTATALTVGAATAVDLATSITMANEIKHKYNVHCADAVAHKAADTANTVSTADATDLTSLETLLNAIKTKFNLHIASTTYHYTADSTNTVATANASDLTTSEALANALKSAYNAHIGSAPAGSGINLVDP